jgi:hypothetical protein
VGPRNLISIRRGITRTVILTRRHAVKIPSLRRYGDGIAGLLWSISRGILANQSETEWWRNAPPETRTVLCPVRWSLLGGVINVYPRCEPFEATEEQELAMFNRTWSPVVMDPSPGDDKAANFGWLVEHGQRRVVRIDYDMNYNGCPHDRSGFANRLAQDAT